MIRCENGKCHAPQWMALVLLIAACYHLGIGLVALLHTEATMKFFHLRHGNESMLLHALGVFYNVFGIALFLAARDPIKHWRIIAICTLKILIVSIFALISHYGTELPHPFIWFALLDDWIWMPPFAMILWTALQVKTGRPISREHALTIEQAAQTYKIQDGTTLAEASQNQTLVLVFLRHFGCTFTRQLLRSLQSLENDAAHRSARLVLIHMLERGEERRYISDESDIARIADPHCELYRAFGLGKGGFWELFGPRVWYRGAIAIFRGCGAGHLAGDGLQMPGAFLFRNNRIIAAQAAKSAADLPELEKLFPQATSEITQ